MQSNFDRIANRKMEYLSYTYLNCDLLDVTILIRIIFVMKSPYIEMHEQYLQKDIFINVKFFVIELKIKRGFEKCDMHVMIIIELMIIMSSIILSEPELVPMFFHIN